MKAWWRTLAGRIDALSERERLLVFAAVIVVSVFLMHAVFVAPVQSRMKARTARMQQQQSAIQTFKQQILDLEARRAAPDAANLVRRDAIKVQIGEIDETLKGMEQGLVAAPKMKQVLQEMLARSPRLKLITLRTLPTTPLVDKPAKPDAAGAVVGRQETGTAGNVYKHGVRITLQGGYSDLHDYLARIEKLPWRMFWSRAVLEADDYPQITLTVTIYTLSLDRAWLEV